MAVMGQGMIVGHFLLPSNHVLNPMYIVLLQVGQREGVEGWEVLARANDLIAEVERGKYNGVGIWVRDMTNMYHLLLHGEGEYTRAEGGSGGGGVGRMVEVLMLIVDNGEGDGDGIGGGVGAQVITARPAR